MRREVKRRKRGKHNTQRTCKGKVRYRDHQEATRALHRIGQGQESRSRTPQRAYDCHLCNGVHLTSAPTDPRSW